MTRKEFAENKRLLRYFHREFNNERKIRKRIWRKTFQRMNISLIKSSIFKNNIKCFSTMIAPISTQDNTNPYDDNMESIANTYSKYMDTLSKNIPRKYLE